MTRFLRAAAAVFSLGIGATFGCGARASVDPGFTTSLTLARTRLPSTQTAEATLTVNNRTTSTLSFYGATIYERVDFTWRPLRRFYSGHPVTGVQIAPAERRAVSVKLPSCAVYSDPCSEEVRVEYAIVMNGVAHSYKAILPRYEFYPDPSATYDIAGLSGNRPVFITPGFARDTLVFDTLRIDFAAARSEPQPPFTTAPPLVSELADAMTKAGVTVGPNGFDAEHNPWLAQVYVPNAPDQRDAIASALAIVKERFWNRITSVSEHVYVDPDRDLQDLIDRADANARQQAQDLSETAGAGDLSSLPSLTGWPRIFLGNTVTDQYPDVTRGRIADGPIVFDTEAIPPSPVSTVVQSAFVGSRPAQLAKAPAGVASVFRSLDIGDLPPIEQRVAIAADRPELYVLGSASATTARARGLLPYFAAMLDARTRILALARSLGVHAERPSLFALYPMDATGDLRTIGLATTFSGSGERAQTGVRDDQVKVSRSEDSRERAMVPIDVPAKSTVILEVVQALAGWPPDGLRLDVELVSAGSRAKAVDRARIVANLRSLPYVIDAAYGEQVDSYVRARYEVLLRGVNRAQLLDVVDLLRTAYADFSPRIAFTVGALAFDCPSLERRLLKAGVRENLLEARNDARATGRNLRKLLLIALLPPSGEADTCRQKAQAPDSLGYMQPGSMPALPQSVRVSLTSLIAFRTFPRR